MQEQTMLGAFVRLVDNLFVEGLVAQVVACTKGLLNLLAGHKASDKVGTQGAAAAGGQWRHSSPHRTHAR
jgi:hypothetical protein